MPRFRLESPRPCTTFCFALIHYAYFVHGQGQKREQKPTTKKVLGFHNHSPLLTMLVVTKSYFKFSRGGTYILQVAFGTSGQRNNILR